MESSLRREATDYAVLVKKKGDNYICYIKELTLMASDSNLDEAYEKIITKKEDLFSKYSDSGILDQIPQPTSDPIAKNDKIMDVLILFSAKALIGVVLAVFLIFFASYKAESLISQTLGTQGSKGNFVKMLENKIENAASHQVSEEGKKRSLKNVRNIVNMAKPYVDELKVLFQDEK